MLGWLVNLQIFLSVIGIIVFTPCSENLSEAEFYSFKNDLVSMELPAMNLATAYRLKKSFQVFFFFKAWIFWGKPQHQPLHSRLLQLRPLFALWECFCSTYRKSFCKTDNAIGANNLKQFFFLCLKTNSCVHTDWCYHKLRQVTDVYNKLTSSRFLRHFNSAIQREPPLNFRTVKVVMNLSHEYL